MLFRKQKCKAGREMFHHQLPISINTITMSWGTVSDSSEQLLLPSHLKPLSVQGWMFQV